MLSLFLRIYFVCYIKFFLKGLMGFQQYWAITKILQNLSPINLLVFGLGNDSLIWQRINSLGKTVFLEDDEPWIEKFKKYSLDIRKVTYSTKVEDANSIGFDEKKLKINLDDDILNIKWDCIIVDAPLGHQPPRKFKGPGRMSSIYMTSILIKKESGIVFVDDFGREVERKYSFHFLKKENLIRIIQDKLAIFKFRNYQSD